MTGARWPSLGGRLLELRQRMDHWLDRTRDRLDKRRAHDPRLRPWYEGARPFPFMNANIVLSYSAKSACTTVVMWYLAVEGHRDAAASLSIGPWRYPNARLLWSPRFVRRLPVGRDLSEWTLLRVMRNPLRRLVSSFRHAVRTGYADRDLMKALGRDVRVADGLSMQMYLDFLHRTDLQHCDPHHRWQRNPVDSLGFGRITTIDVHDENLEHALLAFSREMGLPEVPFDTLPHMEAFSKTHNAPFDDESAVYGLDDAALLRHRFARTDAQRRWPGGRLEALPDVQNAARRLYAPDWAWLADPPRGLRGTGPFNT